MKTQTQIQICQKARKSTGILENPQDQDQEKRIDMIGIVEVIEIIEIIGILGIAGVIGIIKTLKTIKILQQNNLT